MAETVNGQLRLTPEDGTMPCCGANANEPGNVKVTGWALIPECVVCNCGTSWDIVSPEDFYGADDDHIYIEKRAG